MLHGRFRLGVGSGENLNEHVLGDPWPRPCIRLEMLEEAIEVMRKLWGGGQVSYEGDYFVVDTARLYSLPEEPPPVLMSAFGPAAVKLAARVADGYVGTKPNRELLERYRAEGGKGPKLGGLKVCWAEDEERHVAAIRQYLDAGYDGVYLQQMGKDLQGFLRFYRDEVEPRLGL